MIAGLTPVVIGHLDDWGLWVAGVVAGLGGVGWLLRRAWRTGQSMTRWGRSLAQTIDALNDLAQYELRPNGGGSIKDHSGQVPQLVRRVEGLSDEVASQATALREYVLTSSSERTQMWAAIEAVAQSSPPEAS